VDESIGLDLDEQRVISADEPGSLEGEALVSMSRTHPGDGYVQRVTRRITPRTLRGFTDELPARARRKERCVDRTKAVFRRYGFSPIETPALKYAEILLGKTDPDAEIDRQVYRFGDQGNRDVAIRFDLGAFSPPRSPTSASSAT